MPSQQRFEGPDLEALLDEVRGRFGAGVPIVEANKIRTGGVGGFFTREMFEVIVEIDEDTDERPERPARPAAAAAAPRPRTLLDLVDAVDDGPTDEDRETVSPTGTSISTDGAAFAAVLERIARATQEEATADDDDDVVVDEPFRSFAETAAPNRPAAPSAQCADERAPADVATMEPPAEQPNGSVLEYPSERPLMDRPAATRPRPAAPAGLTRGERSSAPARPLDVAALGELGFPAPLLRRADLQRDQLHALVELTEQLPRPRRLPETGDTVIALVGDRTGMRQAAQWINERLGLSPDRLMLASRAEGGVFPERRRIATSDDAASRRGAWRRSTRPVLVVVDDPVTVDATSWSRHVLDALEPSAVWAVVDAHRKPEDVVTWAERIGGIDAIAIDGTPNTVSPAAILATGLPVSLIDGHLATPNRWAAVLDERLAAA